MKNRLYQSSSHRFVPEFVGVASRYSQEKQKRTLAEKHRREVSCDLQYRQHMNSRIQKQCASKTLQLSRLQESRRSRFDEIRKKKELEESREAQINRLKERNMESRVSNRKNLEQVRHSLVVQKRQNYRRMKADTSQRQQHFTLMISQKLKQKEKCCESVKQQEAQAQKKISDFHLKKNADYVLAYLERIRQERWLRKQNDRRTRGIRRGIALMDKTIQMKSNCLAQVQKQVQMCRSATEEDRQHKEKLNEGSTSHIKVQFVQFQQSNNPQNTRVV